MQERLMESEALHPLALHICKGSTDIERIITNWNLTRCAGFSERRSSVWFGILQEKRFP